MSEQRMPKPGELIPFGDPGDPTSLEGMDLELESTGAATSLENPVAMPVTGQNAAAFVRKEPYRVRIRLINGESMEGDIYLPHAPRGNPEDTLLHWLQELRGGFFPFRDEYEQTSIVHVHALQWLAAPFKATQHEFLSLQRRVRIIMEHDEELEGILALDVRTLSPRVSDLLNELRPSLAVQTENELFLVNRKAILRVYDLG